jgi:hypothetical protein
MTTSINPDVLLAGIRQLGWRTDTAEQRERMAADIALLVEISVLEASPSAGADPTAPEHGPS